MKLRFRARIALRGINPYVSVDAEQATRLKPGWRRAMPVLVQINGQPETRCRTNLMPVGDGSFYLYLDETVRKASDTKIGDTVQVALEFDADYRGGPAEPMPRWFSIALNRNPAAKEGYAALPPSRKKELVRYLARLKTDEARARNLAQALHVLAGGKGRFMARAWNGG
jgi:hypothetical protein